MVDARNLTTMRQWYSHGLQTDDDFHRFNCFWLALRTAAERYWPQAERQPRNNHPSDWDMIEAYLDDHRATVNEVIAEQHLQIAALVSLHRRVFDHDLRKCMQTVEAQLQRNGSVDDDGLGTAIGWMLNRIRNNYQHGRKLPYAPIDKDIIQHAGPVLRLLLEAVEPLVSSATADAAASRYPPSPRCHWLAARPWVARRTRA